MPRPLLAAIVALGLALPAANGGAQTACDPAYPSLCLAPVWQAGDLDCADVAASWFPVSAPDPHGFDADRDGVGCE